MIEHCLKDTSHSDGGPSISPIYYPPSTTVPPNS